MTRRQKAGRLRHLLDQLEAPVRALSGELVALLVDRGVSFDPRETLHAGRLAERLHNVFEECEDFGSRLFREIPATDPVGEDAP